jgi:hypothetical protein
MSESFGARLRQRREERHIDLNTIAEQTKIKLSLLHALERDDLTHWPSGIFRRAYIRTYAESLGLNPDVAIRDFLETHPEADGACSALTAAADATTRNGTPLSRLRIMVDAALGSFVRWRLPAASVHEPTAAPARPLNGSARTAPHPPVPAISPMTMTPGWLPDAASPDSQDEAGATPDFEWPVPEERPIVEWTTGPGGAIGFAPATPPPDPAGESYRSPDLDAARFDGVDEMPDETTVAGSQPSTESTLDAIAELCTAFGRVTNRNDLERLMRGSADVLNAAGLVVWLWDPSAEELQPALVYGYPDRVLANLPAVRRDADNATAAAFRSGHTCEIAPTPHTRGALVVPLLAPDRCAGVLAIEWPQGVELTRPVRAMATLLAAALAQLAYRCQPADAETPVERVVPAEITPFRPTVQPDTCGDGDDDEQLSPPPLPFTSTPERVIPVI